MNSDIVEYFFKFYEDGEIVDSEGNVFEKSNPSIHEILTFIAEDNVFRDIFNMDWSKQKLERLFLNNKDTSTATWDNGDSWEKYLKENGLSSSKYDCNPLLLNPDLNTNLDPTDGPNWLYISRPSSLDYILVQDNRREFDSVKPQSFDELIAHLNSLGDVSKKETWNNYFQIILSENTFSWLTFRRILMDHSFLRTITYDNYNLFLSLAGIHERTPSRYSRRFGIAQIAHLIEEETGAKAELLSNGRLNQYFIMKVEKQGLIPCYIIVNLMENSIGIDSTINFDSNNINEIQNYLNQIDSSPPDKILWVSWDEFQADIGLILPNYILSEEGRKKYS